MRHACRKSNISDESAAILCTKSLEITEKDALMLKSINKAIIMKIMNNNSNAKGKCKISEEQV